MASKCPKCRSANILEDHETIKCWDCDGTTAVKPTVAAPPKPIPFTTPQDNGATYVLVGTPFGPAQVRNDGPYRSRLVTTSDGMGGVKACYVHRDVEPTAAVMLCLVYGIPTTTRRSFPEVVPANSMNGPDDVRRWAVIHY